MRINEEPGLHPQLPAFKLGTHASNIEMTMNLPADRWVLVTSGPRIGPAVLYWGELLVMLLMGYAIFGGNGLLAWGGYSRQLHDSRAELKVVQAERARIANRVNRLDPRHVDPDLADELIRKELNVGHPDEVVVPLH